MKKCYIYITMILQTISVYAMDHMRVPTQLYTIPGQNGLGCEQEHVEQILGTPTVAVATPGLTADLGQGRCQALLRRALEQHPEHHNIVMYAASQGSATILNHLAKTQESRIKCAILQAPLVNGNSAIVHAVELGNVPLVHYWLPYAAKFFYPWYSPAGQQVITSIHTIDPSIPLILIHSQHDLQLPYEDTCALYYALREQGRNNVYFISKKGYAHLWALNRQDKPILDAILARHGLKEPTPVSAAVNLAPYQPDHQQFREQYNVLRHRAAHHARLKYGIVIATAAAGTYVLARLAQYGTHTVAH